MRVLIFGATGMLGRDLLPAFAAEETTGLGSRDADLRDSRQVQEAVQKFHPDCIILSAAYTDVDGCETNPEQAFAVNRDGAIHVASAARQVGAKLIFVSTDYVFDGKKRTPYEVIDPRNPINIYGRSKAEAEVRLLEILPESCIVRTSWLFGKGGKCFPDTILHLAKTKPELRVVEDQRGCPTHTVDLAEAIAQLARKQASGILHVTNREECSWYEFAREILKAEGHSMVVQPATTAEYPRPAQRPSYSVLSDASLRRHSIEMPTWQDALRRYLAQRNG